MKLAGEYLVQAERSWIYDALHDPEVLSRAMPGCKSLSRTGENEYAMNLNLVISSISGLFNGKIRLADQRPPESFRLLVDGIGRAGFIKGDGVLSLSPNGGATEVRYEGEVAVGGLIAGVGQRLLETTAKMIIKRFFDRLKAEARDGRSDEAAV